MTSPDLDTMHRAVLLDPADDLARLAYADALEEAGDVERAEFVRVQVELDAFPWVRNLRSGEYDARDGVDAQWQRAFDLHDREMRLLWAGPTQWRANWVEWCWSESRDEEGRPQASDERGGMVITPHGSKGLGGDPQSCGVDARHGMVKQIWRRGFIQSVALPLAAFMDNAEVLFRAHPITAVRLTDRDFSYAYWVSSGRAVCSGPGYESHGFYIPYQIFRRLKGATTISPGFRGYATTELAHAALSAASVAYGRRKAGLPPLPVHPRYEHAGEMDR